MKNKKRVISVAILLMSVLVVSGCFAPKKKKSNSTKQPVQKESMESVKEEIVVEDAIEFSDPGTDELGQEVKELDSLVNELSPSEFDEVDLSEGEIEKEVELQ